MLVLEHEMQCSKVARHAGSETLRGNWHGPAVQHRLVRQHPRTAAGGLPMISPPAAPAMPLPEPACRPSSALPHPLSGEHAYKHERRRLSSPAMRCPSLDPVVLTCMHSHACQMPPQLPPVHLQWQVRSGVSASRESPSSLAQQCRLPGCSALPAACPWRPEPHHRAAQHAWPLTC